MASSVLLILLGVIPFINGYASGPPVSDANVCDNMTPQHGASAQTVAAPFEVLTNTNDCYNENIKLQVVVRTKSGQTANIEGVFVQARESGSSQTSGTFTTSDSVLSTLKCGTSNSAVGHNKEKKATYRSMTWKPQGGSSARPDVYIMATVVEHKATFWVKLSSAALKYDTTCTENALLTDVVGNNAVVFHISSMLILFSSLLVSAVNYI